VYLPNNTALLLGKIMPPKNSILMNDIFTVNIDGIKGKF
jgi:hypothetical protein